MKLMLRFLSCTSLMLTSTPGAKRSKNQRRPKAKTVSRFSSPGVFDALCDIAEGPMPKIYGHPNVPSTPSTTAVSSWTVPKETPDVPMSSSITEKQLPQLIPAWNKDFWRVYGNKVRVNGTIEGLCDFSEARLTNGAA